MYTNFRKLKVDMNSEVFIQKTRDDGVILLKFIGFPMNPNVANYQR